jgi:hypothetical protein
VLSGKWQQTYHDWLKVGSGGSTTIVGEAGPGSVGPAMPDKSVQFNRSGAFGGHAGFTFDETSTTAEVGFDHTPGAASNLLVGSGHTVT